MWEHAHFETQPQLDFLQLSLGLFFHWEQPRVFRLKEAITPSLSDNVATKYLSTCKILCHYLEET